MKSSFVVWILIGTFMSISGGVLEDWDEYSTESEAENIPEIDVKAPEELSRRRTTLPNSNRVSYDQECGQWTKCATQSWLSCRNGRCECFKPEEMEFNSDQGKCVAKAGERCKYIAGELDGRSLFDSVGCVDNAVCSVDGVCTCEVGLYESPEGHCVPLKEHGDECVAHLECSKERGLWCNNGTGTCACNNSDQGLIYDNDRDECIALATKKCRRNGGEFVCVANAFCNVMDMCECSENFYATSNDTCSPVEEYGGQCEEDAGCNRHYNLGCYGGICGCDTNRTTILMEHCVGQADRPCVDYDYGYKCTEFATCVRGVCRCHPNYYRNSEGQCARTLRRLATCTHDFQCSQEPHPLKCIGGQCQCDPEVSVFATVKRAKRPGQSNRWSSGAFLGYEHKSYAECVPLASLPCQDGLCAPGAYCKYFRKELPNSALWDDEEIEGDLNAIGICQCEPGLSLSKSKTCVPGYGQLCSSERSCMEGLYCKNDVCSCKLDPHSEGYNSTSQTCYSNVGGPCESNDNCGKNAYCEKGLCECPSGFVTGPTRVCEAEGGGSCNNRADCDSIAGLNCVNNVCECPGFGLYDAGLRKCLGLVGGQCESEKDCVRPAVCFKEHSQVPGLCNCPTGFEGSMNYTCAQTL